MLSRLFVLLICCLLVNCASLAPYAKPGVYPILNQQGKVVAQLQTVIVKPQDVPPQADLLNPVWWMECGGSKSSFTAPTINNGAPYLPTVTNQTERDLLWWLRNPACNFVGFIVGFEGRTFKVTGTHPTIVTMRDLNNGSTGWTWAVINGWAPFVSYYNGKEEFYLGWRPTSGGIGAKFVIHSIN